MRGRSRTKATGIAKRRIYAALWNKYPVIDRAIKPAASLKIYLLGMLNSIAL
jgi:hypothetical protein